MVDKTPPHQHGEKLKSEKPVLTVSTILAATSLLVSVWVGVSYWNLRDDYVGLKAEYTQRMETVKTLAEQSIILTEQLNEASTPKVRVINLLEAATNMAGANVNSPEGLEQGFLRIQKIANDYAAQGYLLIDADSVISAPENLQLNLEELNGQ